MNLFLNQASQHYAPYFVPYPNPNLYNSHNSHTYYYLSYGPTLLQQSPPFFLNFSQLQQPLLPAASFEQQNQEKVQTQENKPYLENKEELSLGKNQSGGQGCVKGLITEQLVQLSGANVPKSGNDRFIKKNTESNIINQIFSFLWSPEKSLPFISKIVTNHHQSTLFYDFMRVIKNNSKGVLKRHFLKQLTQPGGWEAVHRKLKKKLKDEKTLEMAQISCIVRKLSLIYLRQISRFSIMTSKKMNHRLWNLHFMKCHEIQQFLFRTQEN